MQLRRFLRQQVFDAKFRGAPIVAQYSSIGDIDVRWLGQLQDSFSEGLVAEDGFEGALRTSSADALLNLLVAAHVA